MGLKKICHFVGSMVNDKKLKWKSGLEFKQMQQETVQSEKSIWR